LPPDSVVFGGRVARPEMVRCYSGADLFAFPGVNESLGMVYLEAQACGLPVAAFGNWGAAEAVVHGRTGLLADAGEAGSFVRAVARLAADPDLRRRLGKEAAAHVRQSHDLARNYHLVEERLRSLTGR